MSTRTQVSHPDDRRPHWIKAAEKAGVGLSEWIDDMCMAGLPKSVQRKLKPRKQYRKAK